MNDELSEFFIAGFVGILGWFFGGLDGYTKVLIAFAVIDYITGICRAGAEGAGCLFPLQGLVRREWLQV